MKHEFHSEKTLKKYYSRTRSSHKDDEGNIIPFSRIDDYQSSITNFSTRVESGQIREKIEKREKRRVQFNPLISVINIQSYKKENYELTNDVIIVDKKEEKCALCSIF